MMMSPVCVSCKHQHQEQHYETKRVDYIIAEYDYFLLNDDYDNSNSNSIIQRSVVHITDNRHKARLCTNNEFGYCSSDPNRSAENYCILLS